MGLKKCFLIAMLLSLIGCDNSKSTKDKNSTIRVKVADEKKPLFTMLSPEETGIAFINKNIENDRYNFYKYEYFYNGGGVAVADFNNDGLQDVYFTANMGLNKLYLNKGNLQFEDITKTANINSKERDWCTGVTIVDINNDGWQDILVSRSGWFKGEEKKLLRNLLFVNNGDLTFTERGLEYGFEDLSPTTQITFFDADNDGDLDAYQINHPTIFKTFNQYSDGKIKKINSPEHDYSDIFYINNNGKYIDKTKSYGLENSGHGLGVITSDFNNDGWQDFYVSNDYLEPDYIYMNQKNGTFKNEMLSAFKHISKFSMGVDVADINNDGFQDIFNVEMLAKDNFSKKASMAPMDVKSYWTFVEEGYHYQDMHNSLQLNNGNGTFSEIAWLANVAETDWSWCPLFADFDNDGYKDLFISNGYKRDILSKDFSKKLEKQMEKEGAKKFTEFSHLIPTKKIANYIFQNNKDLTFTDKTRDWGINHEMNSNGAAYADLDNDGDLDIIINNIDDQASVFRNNSNGDSNFLDIVLKNNKKVPSGAKIEILDKDNYQVSELKNAKGYQSISERKIHFGLGDKIKVDSLLITWPNGKQTLVENIQINMKHTIDLASANFNYIKKQDKPNQYFQDITNAININYVHKENDYNDYEKEVLLPHKLSQEGPFFDVADINNDGLDDFFIGSGVGYAGELFIQKKGGEFVSVNKSVFAKDKLCEDLGVLFFDYDKDGDKDLYVVSGSNEYELDSPYLQDRVYENDGKGNFLKTTNVLPVMQASGSCVKAADYDKDGDLDLFVGGFLIPNQYPKPGKSFLLENRDGKFIDVTKEKAKGLQNIGMVKAAEFVDINADNNLDLVVTGQWMPIEIYINDGTHFINETESYGLANQVGWWNSLLTIDINKDGYKDIVAGNLGTNTKHKASEKEPFKIYAKDFDNSGTNDVVLGYYNDGKLYPVRGKQCSAQQLPEIDEKVTSYNEFGLLKLEEIYGKQNLENATSYDATNFKSTTFINLKGKSFDIEFLPNQAQLAPTNGILSLNINKDDIPDLLLVGNHYPVEVETGRYDAHVGNVLINNNDTMDVEIVPALKSGFFVNKDCRDIGEIKVNGKSCIMVSSNRDVLKFYSVE
ncbi:VCBS repeat-containing protein [uncultured Winogradskyella sp.]|uniref:VCBS repeat-containing protein n=3 Tax=Winogradskyella TaxID=286104 RepID=UPI0030DBCF5D